MKRKAVQIVLSLTLTAAMCFGAPAMAFAGETTAKEESTDKTEAKDSTEEKEEAKETNSSLDGKPRPTSDNSPALPESLPDSVSLQ